MIGSRVPYCYGTGGSMPQLTPPTPPGAHFLRMTCTNEGSDERNSIDLYVRGSFLHNGSSARALTFPFGRAAHVFKPLHLLRTPATPPSVQ